MAVHVGTDKDVALISYAVEFLLAWRWTKLVRDVPVRVPENAQISSQRVDLGFFAILRGRNQHVQNGIHVPAHNMGNCEIVGDKTAEGEHEKTGEGETGKAQGNAGPHAVPGMFPEGQKSLYPPRAHFPFSLAHKAQEMLCQVSNPLEYPLSFAHAKTSLALKIGNSETPEIRIFGKCFARGTYASDMFFLGTSGFAKTKPT